MRIDIATPFAAALALWRRDRALLLPLAGLFLFVPQLAILLLVPASPEPVSGGETSPEAIRAWTEAFAAWASAHGGWYIAGQLSALFGALAVSMLYVARGRPAMGPALGLTFGLLPRYVLATILVTLPTGGLLLFALAAPLLLYLLVGPIFYLFARMMLIAPVLVAERPVGAIAAIGRSWRLTRGSGSVLTCIYAVIAVAGMVAGSVFLALAAMAGDNPLAITVMNAVAAAAAAVAGLAHALVAVVVYARLASKGT
jgi:hypothetical protein